MAIPFSIPNSQSYLPSQSADYLSQPDLGDQPLNATSIDPIQAQLLGKILEAVSAAPPTAPPRKKHNKFVQGMINTDPYLSAVAQHNYQTSPEFAQYARQMQGYNAKQKALGPLASVAGSMGRNDLSVIREQRLQQAQKFRQDLLSQFKPDTRQEYDYTTNTNRYHTYYRDPLRNNQVVYDEWTDYLPIHQMQYAGAGGEPVTFQTSPMPGGPAPVSTGAPGGASAGAPGITIVPTEGGQTAGQRPSNLISNPMPRRGQSPQLVRPSSTAHQAPAGAAENVAHRTAFAIGLDPIIGIQKQAYKSQTGAFGQSGLTGDPTTGFGLIPLAGQNAADYAARSPRLQPLLQNPAGRDILNYNINMQPSLFAYTKSQTGAQFGMQEFDRYRSSFPTSMDDEFTATEKVGSLLRIVRADVIASQQQFHGIEVDPRFTVYIGRVMLRSKYNQMSAEDRIAYIAGGGNVKE